MVTLDGFPQQKQQFFLKFSQRKSRNKDPGKCALRQFHKIKRQQLTFHEQMKRMSHMHENVQKLVDFTA